MVERAEIERFVKTLFGQARDRDGLAFVSSLMNEGQGAERKLLTRSLDLLANHAERWDQSGRGLYVCVNMLKPDARQRSKENAALLVAIHADLDLKDVGIDRDEALDKIKALPLLPTMIVGSGNGLHLYWVLSDPLDATPANIELVEMMNGLALDVVGGDAAAKDVSRLLRLPGTHNTKAGAWKPVTILVEEAARLYDAADLEEWLSVQSPIIHRIERVADAAAPAFDNPYLAVAQRLGFKPSIDVEQRLAAMAYQGVADASIHQTQLAVTASLLSRGEPVDDVVDLVLSATRGAAGQFGERWNWRKEEASIRGMCDAWIKKNPSILANRQSPEGIREQADDVLEADEEVRQVANGGTVVQLSDARLRSAREAAQQAKSKKDKDAVFVVVGKTTIEMLEEANRPLMIHAGAVWQYRDGIWIQHSEELEVDLKIEIQRTCEMIGVTPTTSTLNGAWRYITERPSLQKDEVPWDAAHLIPCSNGVVERDTFACRPTAPEDYLRWRMAVPFGSQESPKLFIRFLLDVLQDYSEDDRLAVIGAIQEWLGLALSRSKPRELRKGLIIHGPSRTGKSQFASIVRALFGTRVCGQGLRSLSERFGYQALWNKDAWIADDAIGTSEDLDDERYKVVVTGEPVTIERKYMAPVEHRFDIPVLFTANNLPRVKDVSDAVFNRSILIAFTHVFEEDQTEKLAGFGSIAEKIIAEELSAVLLWALGGLKRALARGRYDLPAVLKRQLETFKEENNPVGSWSRLAIERNAYRAVDRRDLLASFNQWRREMYGDEVRAWGGQTFFRHLRLICPWADTDSAYAGSRRVKGVILTDFGLDYLDDAKSQSFGGKAVGSGKEREGVNQIVRAETEDRSASVPRF